MLRQNSRNVFFFLSIFFDQKKIKNMIFLPKNHVLGIFWHFLVKIFKNNA